jgi:hypothetical protein
LCSFQVNIIFGCILCISLNTINQAEAARLAGYYSGYDEGSQEGRQQMIYYENLCDTLGLLSYDSVYNPEKWRYYIDNDWLCHVDYLCPNFNKNLDYFQRTFYDDYQLCHSCFPLTDFCYLDLQDKIIHKEKTCLILDTSDFEYPLKNYEFVSETSALNSGYTKCQKCFK